MNQYYIRNDVTGNCWLASASEARIYAGFTVEYSVFKAGGALHQLFPNEVV